ncbi:MAG TPA: hypothetical protein VNA87_01955 [Actinomycetota bacterium]|nr:hypothetical protein [Actinomycetota bacterium]
MVVVADQPMKAHRAHRFRLGWNAILTRPWILLVVATFSIFAWLFQPERTVAGLAKSFALPPLDVYSDAAVRTRGWGAFILLLLLRWIALAVILAMLVGTRPSIKRLSVSLIIYAGAALSYAIPMNLGRTLLLSSTDETSSLPALMVVAAPIALVILTRLFTELLLRAFDSTSSKLGWLVPALSVALWVVGPRILQSSDITAVSVLMSMLILTVQTMLLASLVGLRTDPLDSPATRG